VSVNVGDFFELGNFYCNYCRAHKYNTLFKLRYASAIFDSL